MAPYEFFGILANSAFFFSIKRITKNQKEFSRGENVSPKVSKVIDTKASASFLDETPRGVVRFPAGPSIIRMSSRML